VTARMPASGRAALGALEFLPRYYDTLDARGHEIVPMLAPDFTFAFLWADETGAREFTGGDDEFHGYMAQRDAAGQRHHLDLGARDECREVALGYTTRHGDRLGTFLSAAWLDGEERVQRLYSARTLAFGDVDLTPGHAGEPGPATFMPAFLQTLDETPLEVVPMLSPELRFSVIWSDERGVHEFAGGLPEYHGYLEQREADGQRHHLALTARAGQLEVALAYTTRWGDELGTFLMFTELDECGRLRRFLAARTLAFRPIWNL
jgi:hypothetical protein